MKTLLTLLSFFATTHATTNLLKLDLRPEIKAAFAQVKSQTANSPHDLEQIELKVLNAQLTQVYAILGGLDSSRCVKGLSMELKDKNFSDANVTAVFHLEYEEGMGDQGKIPEVAIFKSITESRAKTYFELFQMIVANKYKAKLCETSAKVRFLAPPPRGDATPRPETEAGH